MEKLREVKDLLGELRIVPEDKTIYNQIIAIIDNYTAEHGENNNNREQIKQL